MADISFDSSGKAHFPTKHHGEVTLSKGKWDTICGQPERLYYRYNGEKIATTLINPDEVRHHRKEPTQFFYYKQFSTIRLSIDVEVPLKGCRYFAVVIDQSTGRICTVYPVPKPKEGQKFKG